ncbi:hypothetical protein [Streptomonospora litoralis]|uniref:Uncharacterized protein n=1 Tax=Streptomonospora litoralis TaxID=2498135 RepID=A0A4P6Q5Y7_9ACTN|nr:hypothetical protein [Streptomonospora litoralis]QBI54304.1 hypothetical protein EKD16_12610 [Streptomonospora litoralis]
MRHFVGFVVGLVLAPVLMLGTGWLLPRFVDLDETGQSIATVDGAVAVGAAAVVALLVTLVLVPPRLTPLLPGITGLSLVAATAVQVLRPALVERVPGLPGVEGAVTLLSIGAYLPLGLALFIPMLVPSRWARKERPQGVTEEEYFDGLYDEDYEERDRFSGADTEGGPGHHRRTTRA